MLGMLLHWYRTLWIENARVSDVIKLIWKLSSEETYYEAECIRYYTLRKLQIRKWKW